MSLNRKITSENMMELNKIHKMDCIEGMKKLPDESIDLIFADPPYNLQLKNELYRPNQTLVDAVNDKWDKFESFEEYDNFSRKWLSECRRVLKKTGSIWVIGSYHNIFRIGKIMQDLGFWILNDIIWIKTNPMPNFKGTRFNNAHETLIWASKDNKSKPTFHYKSMKVLNDDKQMRSDWYLPICTGKERVKNNGKKLHSTQKPEALLHRVIISTSNVNDVVLDPFMGSGTTAAIAKRLQRNFIGFEVEESYIQAANERIALVEPLNLEILDYKVERKPPKVPFGTLVEHNYIQAGEWLYSKDRKYKALIKANGSIEYEGTSGSIHKISAFILSRKANNGWEFWYIKDKVKDKLVSINTIREKFALENFS
ncbi:MAG: site-specific DNA-methyltransferase [Candidatus Heimdallarchaeaceae archaeon]